MNAAPATPNDVGEAAGAADGVALEIDEVVKHFGREQALRGVSLRMRESECLTLLGPSGSGKSTLLKVIAGFEAATSGRVLFRGREISGLSPAERGAGMVFQNYALFPHMTVADNIAYGLRLRRWERARRTARVEEMLELVGLAGYGHRYPRQLSGGQQQRVAIARALAYGPPLLLMDEPLGALDRSLRLEMVEQIRRIHRETGTTIVYVTHDQQEALALSDRIAIMREGRIVELDTPARLYQRPRSIFVADFFGGANLLPLEVLERHADGGASVRCGGATLRLRDVAQTATRLAVRPRALRRGGDAGPGALVVSGVVADALLLGDELEVIVEAPGLPPPQGARAGRPGRRARGRRADRAHRRRARARGRLRRRRRRRLAIPDLELLCHGLNSSARSTTPTRSSRRRWACATPSGSTSPRRTTSPTSAS